MFRRASGRASGTFDLPVTMEQIAAVIQDMTANEQRQLLELVPELRQAALTPWTRPEPPAVPDLAFPDLLHFNGINGATGESLLAPQTPQSLLAWIKGQDQAESQDLKDRVFRLWSLLRKLRGEDVLGTIEGIDPSMPGEAGWGVIYPPNLDPQVRQALQPLVDRRRVQCGRDASGLPVEFDYDPVQHPTAYAFRHAHGQEHGDVDPTKLPYYLLIVGSPSEIPFDFQYGLDTQHAVGRLCFDDPADYARYVQRLMAYEDGQSAVLLQRRATLFSPATDPHTELSADLLAHRLAQALDDKPLKLAPYVDAKTLALVPGGAEIRYRTEHLDRDQAAKKALCGVLRGDAGRPALLLTAAHGLGMPRDDAQAQRDRQGAIVCQEFPGVHNWPEKRPVPETMYLAFNDVPNVYLDGMVVFAFGCYSAGTPRRNDYAHLGDRMPLELADSPFVSRLSQRLLAQGALAFIGHVERAWFYSFGWPGVGGQTGTFQSTLEAILAGRPIGHAMSYFQDKYLDLNHSLVEGKLIEKSELGDPARQEELAWLWTARNDARSYVLLGDPLVRLRPELMA